MAKKNNGWKNNKWNQNNSKNGWGKNNKGSSRRNNNSTRRNDSDLTEFARKMGLVQRGLDNPDSRISEAFNRGKTPPQKRPKKTLF